MSVDQNKLDELIREIASKHGIAVGRNDPILMLYTLNEQLTRDMAQVQSEIIDTFKGEMEFVFQRWEGESSRLAENSLNAALAASREVMHQSMQEGAKMAGEAIKEELSNSLSQLAKPVQAAERLVRLNFMAVVLTLAAAISSLVGVIFSL